MNGRFRELAKMFTTQKTDITYQELCANLLLADRNHQVLNLYEMNLMASQSNTKDTVNTRKFQPTRGQNQAMSERTQRGFGRNKQPSQQHRFYDDSNKTCFTCNKQGHVSANCGKLCVHCGFQLHHD